MHIIARPFLAPILWAVIIAVPFHPVNDRLHRVIRTRTAAALISILIVILMVVVPSLLLSLATLNEHITAYQSVSERSAAEGGWTAYTTRVNDAASRWIGSHVHAPDFDLKREMIARLGQLSSGGPAAAFHSTALVRYFLSGRDRCSDSWSSRTFVGSAQK